jgi:hypothetical protein
MSTTVQKKTNTKPKSVAVQPKVDAPIAELPANPFAFEILQLASKQRTNAKKIEVLKKYEHPSLKAIFIWNFDETVISTLPPGEVPYASVGEQNSFSGTISEKIEDAVVKMGELGSNSLGSQDQGHSSIRKEYQKFYNFVKGGNDGLSSLRRETMFINLLQGLHPLEAEIICLVKDKKLGEKYKITKQIVSEAYPDISWGGRS